MSTIRIPRATSKYGVRMDEAGKLARTYCGIVYDSLAEARYAAELDIRVKARDLHRWERQVGFPLMVNGKCVAKIILDFVEHYSDGHRKLVDVKGVLTAVWSLKRKMFEAQYGEPIHIVTSNVKLRGIALGSKV